MNLVSAAAPAMASVAAASVGHHLALSSALVRISPLCLGFLCTNSG